MRLSFATADETFAVGSNDSDSRDDGGVVGSSVVAVVGVGNKLWKKREREEGEGGELLFHAVVAVKRSAKSDYSCKLLSCNCHASVIAAAPGVAGAKEVV